MKKFGIVGLFSLVALSSLAQASEFGKVTSIRFNEKVELGSTHIQAGAQKRIRPNSVFHRIRGEANGFLGLDATKPRCAIVLQNRGGSSDAAFESGVTYSVTPAAIGSSATMIYFKFTASQGSRSSSADYLICSADGELGSEQVVTLEHVKEAFGSIATVID